MKKILGLFLFISLFVIVTFLSFSDFESYVTQNLNSTTSLWAYAAFSFLFLLVDIVLPIPSSLIMILNGKMLGVPIGALLSLTSGMMSSTIGFMIGRASNKYLNRFFKEIEIKKANQFFDQYGNFSVALSRALPILSETISVLTGTTSMKFSQFLFYAFVGHTVVSIIYAMVGSFATQYSGHLITVIVVCLTLLISWISSRFLLSKPKVS